MPRVTVTVDYEVGQPVGDSGGLPPQVAAIWYHHWQRPRLREIPSDVKSIINQVVVALAQSGGAGTGRLAYGPANGETVAEFRADVLEYRSRGVNVLMGIGGSSDGGITIGNETQATQAYDSIVGFVNAYGINGIDIDLEPSGSTWTQPALVSLVSKLKAKYGPAFIVGVTPGLYGQWTAKWMGLAQALGQNMDYMAPMLYDFPEAADSRLSAVAINKCDIMAAAGIPASKMILGFMTKPPEGYANASTPQLTLAAWKAAKAKYPGLLGAFEWETFIEGKNDYTWSRLTGKYIRGL